MSEKKRRAISLLVLALFISLVAFSSAANAGTSGGTSFEEYVIQQQLNSAATNR